MTNPKVALVTAAGSGMGAAIARKLAAEGYAVAINSSSGKAEALAEELGGIAVTGSNLEPDVLKALVDAAMDRWGRIDAVVNSAGHGPKGPVLDLTDADWHLGLDVYLMNVIRMTRLVVPIMEKQFEADGRGGTIANISTYAAFEPEAAFPTSGVFRAGLAAFTKLVTDKYAPSGIRMNNILPGFVDSRPEKPEFRARIPMGRYGRAEEIADVAAFLVSDASSYITGQNLRVDGGITRSV